MDEIERRFLLYHESLNHSAYTIRNYRQMLVEVRRYEADRGVDVTHITNDLLRDLSIWLRSATLAGETFCRSKSSLDIWAALSVDLFVGALNPKEKGLSSERRFMTEGGSMSSVRRKCFISYHHADENEVHRFINTYDHLHNVFIYRGLGLGIASDIVDSLDTDYVLREIRRRYLADSTVTIILVGRCTWARRYVDWEVQASLRHGETISPNGLIAIQLPSAANGASLPNRVSLNVMRNANNHDTGFARYYTYPTSTDVLANLIELAFQRRSTHAYLINNPRERFVNNRTCP